MHLYFILPSHLSPLSTLFLNIFPYFVKNIITTKELN